MLVTAFLLLCFAGGYIALRQIPNCETTDEAVACGFAGGLCYAASMTLAALVVLGV